MRVYLPASRLDLSALELSSRPAHSVTPALREGFPEGDEELLELMAFLAAAEDSLARIRACGCPPCRVVISADVAEAAWVAGSSVELGAPVAWSQVVAIHVDEEEAAGDVAAAVAGEAGALERLAARPLLWFDVTERELLQ